MSEELLSLFYPLSDVERQIRAGQMKPPESQAQEGLVLHRENFLRRGKLIDLRLNYRFCAAPLHSHDFIEMAYVLHGRLTHEIEGKAVEMTEGDLLIMNRNVRHSVALCGQEDIMINFIMLPEYFERAMKLADLEDSPMRRFFFSCILDTDNTPDYLLFNVKEILPLRHLIENMIWSVKNDIPYKQTTNQLTMALLLRLLQYHAGQVRSDMPEYGLIWEIQRYIDRSYRDGSLEEAAEKLHYDYRWMSHEIIRKTGKTFTALMQERRLQQAVYLLKNTGCSVAEIAEQTGYANLTYFYRIFRKAYGITPHQMRREEMAGSRP